MAKDRQHKTERLLLNILLLLSSVMLVIMAAELALRFTRYRYLLISYPAGYMRCDKLSWFDITENHPPITENTYEYDQTLWSNELGCFDLPYKGEKDYLLLVGDSFTFAHAAFEDKYGTLMEQYLGYRILKCGVGGYGTWQEWCKIRKIVQKVKTTPKLIILGYWMGDDLRNDLDCLQRGFINPDSTAKGRPGVDSMDSLAGPSYSIHHPRQSLTMKLKDWLVRHSLLYHLLNKNVLIRRLGERMGLIDILNQHLEFIPLDAYPWLRQAWDFHLSYLKEIQKLADSYNAHLLVVLIPVDFQVYDFLKPKSSLDSQQPNRILRDFCAKENIDCLDLTPLLRSFVEQRPRLGLDSKKDLYWRRDCHLNKRGNRLAALLISSYILERDWIEVQAKAEKKGIIERELDSFKDRGKPRVVSP